MKIRALGISVMALSGLLILTPCFLFPVCGGAKAVFSAGGMMAHPCARTARAEMAVGVIAFGMSVIPLLWPTRRAAFWTGVSCLILGALIALLPTTLLGLCRMPTMACRMGTLPALIILAVLFGFSGLAGIFLARSPRPKLPMIV